tara:strand:+ start:207 stop:869 length:663 start_codon:yes stop_codon:yes gene_type:complete
MSNIEYELNEKIHAILINPYLSWDDFNKNCELIKKFNIKNISTSLNFLGHLKNIMSDHKVKINALISYPFGDLPNSLIEEFICFAKENGAYGIEYTPNFINLFKNNLDDFANQIDKISSSKLPITIIINKKKLDKMLFEKAIEIFLELGITNFQFGDGFGSPISSQDIAEILKLIRNEQSIKIVGGIKTLDQVVDLFGLGIDCVGTSHFYEIFQDIKKVK